MGINEYQGGIPHLQTAVNDARSVAINLVSKHDYTVVLLTNHSVTRVGIKKALDGMSITSEDRLFIYFAGHGIALDGDIGPEGFLLLHESRPGARDSFLKMVDFHALITSLKCRHLLLILDCCFAGAFRWSSTRHFSIVPEVMYRERFERYIRDAAWQVIASAAFDQKALDVVDGRPIGMRSEEDEHSPFASALLAALDGRGDLQRSNSICQARGDGVTTATELYLHLRDRVEVLASSRHRQTPSIWPLAKHDKGEFIFITPGHSLDLKPAPELSLNNNPFRGLNAFEQEHKNCFFGRRLDTENLIDKVNSYPFTVVIGGSGTGKSSLVKAGLLATLAAQENSPWKFLCTRPGENPMAALANLDLPDPDVDLAIRMKQWLNSNPGKCLLLFVDQLEELFTLAKLKREIESFLHSCARVLSLDSESVRVIATLRSDFATYFPGSPLGAWWSRGRMLVSPLSQDELRQAIEGPASVSVLYFTPPELVDRLINDVGQTPGALPSLSFALSEMYRKYIERRGTDRALTLVDYESIGGVEGALRHRASQEYDALNDAQKRTMRRILLRMVSLEGGGVSRRRIPHNELVYTDAEENARVCFVLDRLVKARLIVPDSDQDGTGVLEPAHDALVRGWDLLRKWIQEAQEEIRLRHLLTPAAVDWSLQSGGLWDGNPRLALLKGALADAENWMNKCEKEFAVKSILRRRFRRLIIAVAISVAMSVIAVMALYSFEQRDNARDRYADSRFAEADRVFLETSDAALALHMVSDAVANLSTGHPRRDAMLARANYLASLCPISISGVPQPIDSAVVSENLTTLLVGGVIMDPPPSIWSLDDGVSQMPWPKNEGYEQVQLAFRHLSPDGRFIAVGTFDQDVRGNKSLSIRVWKKGAKKALFETRDGESGLLRRSKFCFSGDGRYFILQKPNYREQNNPKAEVILVDLEAEREVPVSDDAFLAGPPPVGPTLRSSPATMRHLLSMDSPPHVSRTEQRLWLCGFAPKLPPPLGNTNQDWSVRFFDFKNRLKQANRVVIRSAEPFYNVCLSSDGVIFAAVTGSEQAKNFRLRAWNAETGDELFSKERIVKPVPFAISGLHKERGLVLLKTSTEGDVVAGKSKSIELVQLKDGVLTPGILTNAMTENALRLSSDGETVAGLADDLSIRVAETQGSRLRYPLLRLPKPAGDFVAPSRGVVFSQNNDEVTVLSADGLMRSWDLRTSSRLAEVVKLDVGGEMLRAVFSDRGDILATSHLYDAASQINLWNVSTGAKKWKSPIATPAPSYNLDLSADGGFLGVGYTFPRETFEKPIRSEISVYDTASQSMATIAPIACEWPINAVAVSSEGRFVSAVLNAFVARQWRIADGVEVAQDEGDRAFEVLGEDGMAYVMGKSGHVEIKRFQPKAAVTRIQFAGEQGYNMGLVMRLIGDAKCIREHGGNGFELHTENRTVQVTSDSRGAVLYNETVRASMRNPSIAFTTTHPDISTYSSDGRWLATIASIRGKSFEVMITEVQSGLPICNALYHDREILAMKFVEDDQMLATVSKDGVLRKWRFRFSSQTDESWLHSFSEAVSGMRYDASGQANRLSAKDHIGVWKEFMKNVRDAPNLRSSAGRKVIGWYTQSSRG